MQSKLDAADSIQEFLESIRDLQANNQEEEYLAGLDQKLEKIVHTSIRYEMTSGLMITSAQMILRFGFPCYSISRNITAQSRTFKPVPISYVSGNSFSYL